MLVKSTILQVKASRNNQIFRRSSDEGVKISKIEKKEIMKID